jgi:hypothetical protein
MPIIPLLYLSVAFWSFARLFKDLQEEVNLSSEERKYSWEVIILASTLWPIIIPISYLEKRSKAKQQFTLIHQLEKS